jgi:hypothetical protein
VIDCVHKLADGREWHIIDGLVHGADPEVAAWVNMKLGEPVIDSLFVAFGLLRHGTDTSTIHTQEALFDALVAGLYFRDHVDAAGYSDITMTAAVDEQASITPAVMQRVLNYPFRQLGCRRITAEIDLANKRAVSQAQKMGFRLEGKKRAKSPYGDMGVFGLTPAECPMWKMQVAA